MEWQPSSSRPQPHLNKNVHPHTLRHSCGYYLADRGTDLCTMQDYLDHRDPRHTVHYTRVSGRRFEGCGSRPLKTLRFFRAHAHAYCDVTDRSTTCHLRWLLVGIAESVGCAFEA
jgi:hypothetical protein